MSLTSLKLDGLCWGAAALAGVSSCTKLQVLQLGHCPELVSTGLIALPGSITRFETGGVVHTPENLEATVTPSGAHTFVKP